MTNIDPALEAAAIEQMRADRTPPFTTREVVVRLLATTYPAHALEPAIRRAAARDKHLEWRPGTGGYGYRHITPPPPASARPEAQERVAASVQPDRTGGPLGSAPAPRERRGQPGRGLPAADQSAPDSPKGVGA